MTNKLTLDELRINEEAVIKGYTEDSDTHHRIQELGLVIGTQVRLKRFAPFGDPMEIAVRGYNLCLRKAEAKSIIIEKLDYQK